MMKILVVNSSGRYHNSVSRMLTKTLLEKIQSVVYETEVIERDLMKTELPFVNEQMIGGLYIPERQRTQEQKSALTISDSLAQELIDADVLIFGLPIYNFTIPGAFKSYLDLVCRAGLTFQYTQAGPIGLLKNKQAYAIVTSGGTELGGPVDYSTRYLQHVMAFIGIENLEVIAADRLLFGSKAKIESALRHINSIELN